MKPDRIDYDDNDDLDNVFFSNSSVHLEQMDYQDYALMIDTGDRYVIINITDGIAYLHDDS